MVSQFNRQIFRLQPIQIARSLHSSHSDTDRTDAAGTERCNNNFYVFLYWIFYFPDRGDLRYHSDLEDPCSMFYVHVPVAIWCFFCYPLVIKHGWLENRPLISTYQWCSYCNLHLWGTFPASHVRWHQRVSLWCAACSWHQLGATTHRSFLRELTDRLLLGQVGSRPRGRAGAPRRRAFEPPDIIIFGGPFSRFLKYAACIMYRYFERKIELWIEKQYLKYFEVGWQVFFPPGPQWLIWILFRNEAIYLLVQPDTSDFFIQKYLPFNRTRWWWWVLDGFGSAHFWQHLWQTLTT